MILGYILQMFDVKVVRLFFLFLFCYLWQAGVCYLFFCYSYVLHLMVTVAVTLDSFTHLL